MLGYLAIVGGVLSLVLAPVMVIIKYRTGWEIIPQPLWVEPVRSMLGGLLTFATPQELWTIYGSAYTVALVLAFIGLLGLVDHLRRHAHGVSLAGLWLLVAGLLLVIPGDAVHSWTWHQNGLLTPTPGTNPVANTAYAVHMMGMNFVMLGSMWFGITALRRRLLASWLAWAFIMVFPGALLASTVLLPTTPSGALWWFNVVMIAAGYFLATGRAERLTSPDTRFVVA
jgi:hypothetical protein